MEKYSNETSLFVNAHSGEMDLKSVSSSSKKVKSVSVSSSSKKVNCRLIERVIDEVISKLLSLVLPAKVAILPSYTDRKINGCISRISFKLVTLSNQIHKNINYRM